MKQLEGGRSHAFNQVKLTTVPFDWQTGYGAFSVRESHIPQVRTYILNQKEHHHTTMFTDGFNGLWPITDYHPMKMGDAENP